MSFFSKATSYNLACGYILYQAILRVSDSMLIPELKESLSISTTEIGLISSAFYIAYFLFQIPAGLLIDKIGIKKSWLFALITLSIANILFSINLSLLLSIVSRFLMGAGSAFAWVGSVKLVRNNFNFKKQAFFMGILSALITFGAVISQSCLVWIFTLCQGWQNAFSFFSILSLILLTLILFLLKETPLKKPLYLDKNHHLSIRFKKTAKNLIKSKKFWKLSFFGATLVAVHSSFAGLWGIYYLTQSFKLDKDVAGKVMSCFWIGGCLGAPFYGYLRKYLMNHKIHLCFSIVLSTLFLILIFNPSQNIMFVKIILFLMGFISTAELLATSVIAVQEMGHSKPATVMGFYNSAISILGPIFQIFIGFTTSSISNSLITNEIRSLTLSFLIFPVFITLSSLLLFKFRSPHPLVTKIPPHT